jgi:hypothetical protein
MTNDEVMQMEEAKSIAEQEAKEAVDEARESGEKDPKVLKAISDETYRRVLTYELTGEDEPLISFHKSEGGVLRAANGQELELLGEAPEKVN